MTVIKNLDKKQHRGSQIGANIGQNLESLKIGHFVWKFDGSMVELISETKKEGEIIDEIGFRYLD